MSEGAGPGFRRRPFVCGALGDWRDDVMERLVAASPAGTRRIARSPHAALWASAPPATWRTGEERGHYWWPIADGREPVSWRSAAEERLAGGIVLGESAAVLHTCALGAQELYIRRLGSAVYFAVRIDPLLALDPARLHVDHSAWADLLLMSCPMGEATPFQEVRRLTAGTGWRASAGRLDRVSFTPVWLTAEPVPTPDPGRVADALAAAVPAGRRWSPFVVPLSGGWDSRLLAALARRTGRRVTTWTTDPDDGTDRDLRLAGPVAGHLGLRHHTVPPDPDGWLADRSWTLERVQYQTAHHAWIRSLAEVLHGSRGRLLDGLAGDVLLKGSSYATGEVLAATAGAGQREVFWQGLASKVADRPELLATGLAPQLVDRARTDFDRVTDPFLEHPAALNLTQLLTRTARGIAACPLWLLGPETDVRMPFLHPEVIRAGLRAPAGPAAGAAFYREVLRRVGGDALAGLPSTNDPTDGPLSRAARRCQSPTARRGLITSLTELPEVHALLGPKLHDALRDPDQLDRSLRWHLPRLVLLWADALAQWLRRYDGRVVWSAPDAD